MTTNTPQPVPTGPVKTANITTTEITPPKPAKKDRLNLGESLLTAQLLVSPNDIYCLVVQDDGNVGIYKKDVGCIWTSGTWGAYSAVRVARATLNTDGNFVMYTPSGVVKWSSNTAGKNVKYLIMQDDGDLVLSTGTANVWATNTAPKPVVPPTPAPAVPTTSNPAPTNPTPANPAPPNPTLLPGKSLGKGEVLTSANKKFRLGMQWDGKCSLSSDSGTYWATDSVFEGDSFSLQNDGNLGVYSLRMGRNIWSTNVRPPFGSPSLTLRDTGDLVITDAQAHVLWSNNASIISSLDPWIKQAAHSTSPLVTGEYLTANQTLASPNGCFLFSFTSNGLLRLTDKSNFVLWNSGTSYPGASRLFLQFDGNLVLNAADGRTLWASGTWGLGDTCKFFVNDDGNAGVLTPPYSERQWQTSTFFPLCVAKGPFDRIRKGESLTVGQSLVSKNGKYKFQFLDNYNFTIRNEQNATTTVYRTASAPGMRGARVLTLTIDGIFQILDPNNEVKWSSLMTTRGWINRDENWCPITNKYLLAKIYEGWNWSDKLRDDSYNPTPVYRSAELVMQDDGVLALLRNDTQFWNINTFPTGDLAGPQINDTLQVGGNLKVNENLTSYNGQYSLVPQSDNDICIYNKVFGQVWCSNTWMHPTMADDAYQLVMQSDGNLVLKDPSNEEVWASHTWTSNPSGLKFTMQGDGNARITSGNNVHVWETGRQGVTDFENQFLSDFDMAREARRRGY